MDIQEVRAAEREQARAAREDRMRRAVEEAAPTDPHTSLTAIKAVGTYSESVHLGWDYGSYESYPLCGVLKERDRETTDETANCPRCAKVLRTIGMEYLIRDSQGWTGIYRNR